MQIPKSILPMRTEDMQVPFCDDCYLFERAWHGQRALLYVLDHHWYLQDAQGQPLHAPSLDLPYERMSTGHVLDGVWQHTPQTPVRFIAFDVLFFNAQNVMQEPLINRRAILDDMFRGINHQALLITPWLWREGKTAARECAAAGADALIAKHIYSNYVAGNSSASWLKIPLAAHVAAAGNISPLDKLSA